MDLSGINLKNETNVNIDKGSVIIAYHKYQGFALPLVVLLISVLILFFVVIPEINQYSASKQELDIETQKLGTLQNNYNFLSSLDQAKAEADLKVLTRIFPKDKDFLGIINSVSEASAKTGLVLGNYRFSLGDLSKAALSSDLQYPTIDMDLETEGNAILLRDFVNELYKSAPVVSIISLKHKDNKAKLKLSFYFKPFPPNSISDDRPITKISRADEELINKFSDWGNTKDSSFDFLGLNLATKSANVNTSSSDSSKTSFSPF